MLRIIVDPVFSRLGEASLLLSPLLLIGPCGLRLLKQNTGFTVSQVCVFVSLHRPAGQGSPEARRGGRPRPGLAVHVFSGGPWLAFCSLCLRPRFYHSGLGPRPTRELAGILGQQEQLERGNWRAGKMAPIRPPIRACVEASAPCILEQFGKG